MESGNNSLAEGKATLQFHISEPFETMISRSVLTFESVDQF